MVLVQYFWIEYFILLIFFVILDGKKIQQLTKTLSCLSLPSSWLKSLKIEAKINMYFWIYWAWHFVFMENCLLPIIVNIILMERLSGKGHSKKKRLSHPPLANGMRSHPPASEASFHFPLQFSSGLWETITGISSKVWSSAPVGRARLCLWCGTQWPRTACMFSVRAGTTSAMTGAGQPTGAQGIIQVTWQTWLSSMEVSS